jgi:predicted Zn-dependent protease with MMP-like domain
MTRREFEKVVEEAVASLPEMFRKKIENVEFHVAESPNRRQSGKPAPRTRQPTLYGLYEGTPYGDRGPDYTMKLPDRITIFKRAIEHDCKTRPEMIKCIQETVLHEIGHYFGLDDDQLDELGIG